MKFKSLLFLIIAFNTQFVVGQYVTIPDATLRGDLKATFASCFNGSDMLDTNCAKTQSQVYTLNFSSKNISDFTGIQYFADLGELYISNNGLSSIPKLPPNLRTLYCDSNQISSLPKLPNTVLNLYVRHNNFTSLDSIPSQLWILEISDNQLVSLPTIPSKLNSLGCAKNQLSALPDLNNLDGLDCSYNLLASMPSSLNYLGGLTCTNNQLTSLPPINRLNYLDCSNNQIASLGTFSNSLTQLYCSNNLITSLPSFPLSLSFLKCSNNNLTNLPDLPSGPGSEFVLLWCKNNQLNCLPVLPNDLKDLQAAGNNIVCLPNIPTASTFTSDIGNTVCNGSNNIHGCPIGTGILTSDEMDQGINLYPNPTKNKVILNNSLAELSEASVKILSAEGREVYSIDNSDLTNLSIDLSNEQRGIYFVQIISEGSTLVKKLVIE